MGVAEGEQTRNMNKLADRFELCERFERSSHSPLVLF
jgi:hypothetical protein